MNYDDILPVLKASETPVILNGVEATVKVCIVPRNKNGDHTDVCGACRDKMLHTAMVPTMAKAVPQPSSTNREGKLEYRVGAPWTTGKLTKLTAL